MPRAQAWALLANAQARLQAGADLPLYGIPFAVKDNIDVAGLPTTAGCPAFTYNPDRSAFVIERLIAAGAIPIGKTNLDQFATGLNGSRSPYGIPSSAFDAAYVSGGSSSGSALAVADGLVPFALGTDTAGSGRGPAGVNNIVGLKPTRGLLSNRGLVPACRTLDCISIFAASSDDALTVSTSPQRSARWPATRLQQRFCTKRRQSSRSRPLCCSMGGALGDLVAATSRSLIWRGTVPIGLNRASQNEENRDGRCP